MRVTNFIPLGCSLLEPVHTANFVQTLKVQGLMEKVFNYPPQEYLSVIGCDANGTDLRFCQTERYRVNIAKVENCQKCQSAQDDDGSIFSTACPQRCGFAPAPSTPSAAAPWRPEFPKLDHFNRNCVSL